MSAPVEIRQVENQSDLEAFFRFPWQLYQGDPHWVPPLLSLRREQLDKSKNPAWQYMEGEYFTAWRGDKIVGTISAHINHRHNEFHEEHIGWFGMFEVYDDQEAATALLDTATGWVRDRGYDAIRGPASFTTLEEVGLLIDGFTRPVLLMPYNPPYYRQLVESAGFVKAMDVHSVIFEREALVKANTIERAGKITERLQRRSGAVIRPMNRRRKKQEFELFKEIYNRAWEKNWGFVPMTEAELDAMVESLSMFLDPDFAFFAEIDGEPVGFMLSVPDLNQVLHRVYPRPGVPELWSMAKALWHWKLRPVITGMRTPLMGVVEEHRDKGIDIALYYATVKTIWPHKRYQWLDASWILETNELLNILDSFGGRIYKTHRFYEKKF